MITDANGMPVLQPLVDDASTATFNAAFAQIGTVIGSQDIKSYKWANASARNAQAGMSEGDLGYQRDSKFVYVYSGTAWVSHGPADNPVGEVVPATGYSFVVNELRRSGNTITLYINVSKVAGGNWGGTHVIGQLPVGATFNATRDVIGQYWTSAASGALRVATNGNVLLYLTPSVANTSSFIGTATWVLL